jgi:hypothetical protein
VVGPAGFVEGALPGTVEQEIHVVPAHHSHVGKSDIGIRVEQYPKGAGCAVVLRRTILIGIVERPELVAVDECGSARRGAS